MTTGGALAKITLSQLKRSHACSQQVELFESLFGAEIEVTRAGCAAVADRFDWEWAAKHLLTAPALADYERIAAPAWADYERIRDTAWADYERIAAWAFCDAYNAPVQA